MLHRIVPPTKLDYAPYGEIWVVDHDTMHPKYYLQASRDTDLMEWIPVAQLLEAVWHHHNSKASADHIAEYLDLMLTEYMNIKNNSTYKKIDAHLDI